MGLEGRLDPIRPDASAPWRRVAAFGIAGRGVGELDDPPLRPGSGEQVDVAPMDLVDRSLGHLGEGPLDVVDEDLRQAGLELLERRRQVRVVLVGIAGHEASREHDGHRLLERQLQWGQEPGPFDAPATLAVAPDRDAQLGLEGDEVAVHGPRRHPDPLRDLAHVDARLALRLEHAEDAIEARQPVAFALVALVRVDQHRRSSCLAAHRARRGQVVSADVGPTSGRPQVDVRPAARPGGRGRDRSP